MDISKFKVIDNKIVVYNNRSRRIARSAICAFERSLNISIRFRLDVLFIRSLKISYFTKALYNKIGGSGGIRFFYFSICPRLDTAYNMKFKYCRLRL